MEPVVDQLEQPVVEEAAPVAEEVVVATAPAEMMAVTQAPVTAENKIYPSLYDTLPTTIAAIAIGVGIIGGIQWTVRNIFSKEKADHRALTQFVTSMFALIVGVWIADKLIAGPTAELIDPGESAQLLTFIKDITLMVFSYYFGTKANVPAEETTSTTDGGE